MASACTYWCCRTSRTAQSANLAKELTMKTILSALIALSFVAGIAAPSSATPSNVDAKKLFEKLDKEGRGGHQN
jgi:hypothetical protein